MPLDEATRQLAVLLQLELRRLVERERARTERGEEVRYDSVSRIATWETRRGDVIGRWYGDVLARYVVRDRILRWDWAGRSSIATTTHAEVISREGQARGVPQLSMSVVGELDEPDAYALVRLGVLVAHGEGVELRRTEEELTFIGLFDSPRPRDGESVDPSRYSVPPPPVARSSPPADRSSPVASWPPAAGWPAPARRSSPAAGTRSTPPAARSSTPPAARRSSQPPAHRSLPPIREIYGPRTAGRSPSTRAPEPERRVREPSRSIFLPVASAVLAVFAKAVPGFQQALFVLRIEPETRADEGRRLVVLLAANDASGDLRAIDPSPELLAAAARLVEADQNDGNGPWSKLSARITPKPDGGATLNVDVI
ncbi:MAG: hypothetical protein KF850_04975 [Labilithrix sp.]|nr:hypothetical protein [Labilithrix sp.]